MSIDSNKPDSMTRKKYAQFGIVLTFFGIVVLLTDDKPWWSAIYVGIGVIVVGILYLVFGNHTNSKNE